MSSKYNVRFNVVAGCESGILKGIDTENNAVYNVYKPTDTYVDGVSNMSWSSDDERVKVIFSTKKNTIHSFDFLNETVHQIGSIKNETQIIGLAQFKQDRLAICCENGSLSIESLTNDESLETLIETNAGANLCRMRMNEFNKLYVGTGGNENDLKIWCLDEFKSNVPTFHAKNVRPNFVRLRMPVWVMDLQFLDERNRCLVTTGHHQIRLYDPQTDTRRPVHQTEFEQYPITSISLLHSSDNSRFIVGNTQGEMAEFDLKRLSTTSSPSSLVHKYKGFAGSIRSIDTHPTKPLIVSASIDRFLRVHHAETKQLISKFYLKSRLTSVLISPHQVHKEKNLHDDDIEQTSATINDDSEKNGDDMDDIWSKFKKKSSTKFETKRSSSQNNSHVKKKRKV